jgi:hypothetical protein
MQNTRVYYVPLSIHDVCYPATVAAQESGHWSAQVFLGNGACTIHDGKDEADVLARLQTKAEHGIFDNDDFPYPVDYETFRRFVQETPCLSKVGLAAMPATYVAQIPGNGRADLQE